MTTPTLNGAHITLSPFGPDEATARYVGWLNDPEVNALSRRADKTTTLEAARHYLATRAPDEQVLAIHFGEAGHVGNIKYGPIDRENARADISIVIGERAVWGRGVGREAIYLVTRYLFEQKDLNRVDAGTGNPAFVRMVTALGWRTEGIQRQRVRIEGRFHDWTLLALLRAEFTPIPDYHEAVPR